ncbi:MAG: uracil-DNA glycosylase [Alcanivoracaceae bacterium]|nr:uracil-DNA glycosylase [Alcanivoracaceae bacterium]
MTNLSFIDEFVAQLRKQKNTALSANPYRRKHCAENLRAYLQLVQQYWASSQHRKVLLVGEALGFKGGMLTGIPFSSGKVFQEIAHPFLMQLAPSLTMKEIESENTASMVWRYLETVDALPLCWNAYPFHPHIAGRPLTNRAPTSAEVNQGGVYLRALHNMFLPDTIIGVGRKGAHCAAAMFPNAKVISVRHPSFGGKREFEQGLNAVLT